MDKSVALRSKKDLNFFWAKCLLTNAVNIEGLLPRRADMSRIVKR